MRPLFWLALIALTACAQPAADPSAPDPEPDPQPEAPAEPDPTPDPQPTPDPVPEPDPQPEPDPEPEPTPDPEPEMPSPLDTALANAAEVCEDACATYAGDACLGDGFPADQCADFCDYPTIFADNFDHLDERTALGCAEAFTVLDACLAALSCEDVQVYLAADPEGDEDYPCKPKDDALALACPPEGERMFSPEMQTAFASAEDACETACAAYAGDACLGDDLPLQDCLAFCPYADILPERFPGLDNDALACVESFETLELCLTDLSCEDVRLYFALDPEGFPCQTEDEAIATTCAPFEQP